MRHIGVLLTAARGQCRNFRPALRRSNRRFGQLGWTNRSQRADRRALGPRHADRIAHLAAELVATRARTSSLSLWRDNMPRRCDRSTRTVPIVFVQVADPVGAELVDSLARPGGNVIAAAVRRSRNPLRGETEIALKVGAVVNRHKMAKHFDLFITQTSLSFHRKAAAIAAEEALDGIYVVRTNLPKKALNDAAAVGAYKSLARVERAFRSLKTVDIHLRPIFHWTAPRVRAHVLLCMLAYHVEHHMRTKLAPMLYDETDHEAAAAMRSSIVARAEPSDAARRKQTTGLVHHHRRRGAGGTPDREHQNDRHRSFCATRSDRPAISRQPVLPRTNRQSGAGGVRCHPRRNARQGDGCDRTGGAGPPRTADRA